MTFKIPNTGDAFHSNQAEPDSIDFDIIIAAHDRTGVRSGCAVSAQGTPDMTVAVAAGTIVVAGVDQSVGAGNVTITAADGSNPRFDLVVANNSGTKSAVAGSPNANPVFPAIPANSVVLAAVYVPAGVSSILSNLITDKRVLVATHIDDLSDVDLTGIAAGSVLYWNGTSLIDLGIGTAGQVLKVNSGATAPEWGTATSGTTFAGVSLRQSAQTISTSLTVLAWNSEDFDTDGFHDTVTNNQRITIPTGKGGYYRFDLQVTLDRQTANQELDLIIRKNGTTTLLQHQEAFDNDGANQNPTVSINGVVNLVVGDYVEVTGQALANHATTAATGRTYLMAQYLGS